MKWNRKVAIAVPATGEDEWQAVREPIMSGWLAQGSRVRAFERTFAKRHGAKHAVATTSGTTALHIALLAVGVGPGDEVIVPAFSWIASANAVLYCGATPVFVDIDPKTFNIDTDRLAAAVTTKTKAIMPVHLFGLCADVDAVSVAAPGVTIVEDAACAAGASYRGRPAGSLGRVGAFSFHPRKIMTTGEGGMVTTDSKSVANHLRRLRNHGARASGGPMPEFAELGFNYRMTGLQASIGLVQLEKLDTLIEERQRWAEHYQRELASISWLTAPVVGDEDRHGWQSYVCTVDQAAAPCSRNQLMEELAAKGVSTRPGTHAIHLQSYYRERFGLAPDDFPVARDADRDSLAIPLHNRMDDEDCEYVAQAIHSHG